jgi:GNAT superfamily N-acetyltransferase
MPERKDPTVHEATIFDVDLAAPLFDAYRQFYGQPGDLELARQFLMARIRHGESIVLMALEAEDSALGFAQLYRSFSSASAAPILILNDLFVRPDARRKGVGTLLLGAAVEYGRKSGAMRMTLSTEIANTAAQALYEAQGWKRQTDFYVYNLALEGG